MSTSSLIETVWHHPPTGRWEVNGLLYYSSITSTERLMIKAGKYDIENTMGDRHHLGSKFILGTRALRALG